MKSQRLEALTLSVCGMWFAILAWRGLDYGLPNAQLSGLLFRQEEATTLLPLVAQTREQDRQQMEPYKVFGHEKLVPPQDYLQQIVQEYPIKLNGTMRYGSVNKMKWIGASLLSSQLPDEQVVIHAISQMQPRHLDFNPRHFTYGGAYLYPVAAAIGLGALTGIVTPTADRLFYLEQPEQVRRIFLLGKSLGIVAGVAMILLIYLVGRLLFDRTVGVWAAVLASSYPPYLIEVYHLKPFLWSSAWLLVGLAAFALWQRHPRARWLLLSGVAIGLTVGSTLVMWPIVLVPLASIGWSAWRGHLSSAARRQAGKALVMLGLTVLVTFVAVNPYLVTTWRMLFDTMREISHDESYGRLQFFNPAFHAEVFQQLGVSLGMLGSLCAAIGVAWALVKRTPADGWLLGGFSVVYLLAFKWIAFAHPVHHLTPVLAVVLLLMVRWMVAATKAKAVWLRGVGRVLLACLIGHMGLMAWRYSGLYAATSPQVAAGQWINTHVPREATIGSWIHVDGVRYGFPLFRYLEYHLVHDPQPHVPTFYEKPPDYLLAMKRTDMPEPLLANDALLREYQLVARFAHPGLSAFSQGQWRALAHYLIEEVRIYQHANSSRQTVSRVQ